jgi:membrane fusion protein, cation efflux system
VLIPVTALVDDNGRQLVFVQYENFYEPVPVITGATQGDLIEVTDGLSIGEQLVTQGSLSLYAESRKTQTAEATPAVTAATAPEAENVEAPMAAGIEEPAEASTVATESSGGGFPVGLVAALGGVAVLLAGAVVVSGKKKGE